MVIYCDRLTLGACTKAIQLRRGTRFRRITYNIQVLDSIPGTVWPVLLRFTLRLLGFRVEEVHFFAGHVRTPDGQSVYLAARKVSIDLAFRAAERILTRSKFLARLNHKWGRNTIFKHVARSLEMPAMQIALRFKVAEALRHTANDNKVLLITPRRLAFDPDLVCELTPGLRVYFYRSWSYESLKWIRGSALFFLIFAKLRETKWWLEILIGSGSNIQDSLNALEASLPSLLVLQEDELSLDRSYRTQPHWLFTKNGKPPFRTIVLQSGSVDCLSFDNEGLKEQGIIPVSKKELYLLARRFRSSSSIRKRIHQDLWKCIFTAIFGSSTQAGSLFEVAQVLYNADALAAICERSFVRAFMSCENYMSQTDAIQLIAPTLDITTLSYQYSNMGKVGPLMMTTADIMLTFAPLYHQRWTQGNIRPRAFVDMGYVYDTSFEYVRGRARDHRRRLTDAGAQFIICYFDESVQTDKYGLTSQDDHCAEILILLRLVLDDPSIGLVIKTQFQRNSPQNFDKIAGSLEAANATGRYIELAYGTNRNIIFPAEAALSADIAIDHAVGATAALEAALVGVRCVLLNPYGMRGDNDILYKQADIVYPSLASALKAIHSFREGTPGHEKLGDWLPIIDQFDPFRDGRAGHRLRHLLEKIVLQNSV